MLKYFFLIACFGILACSTNSTLEKPQSLWQFEPLHNNAALDHNCQPLINKYQAILKGLQNKDTFYMHQSSRELIQILDSLNALHLINHTALQNIWSTGLQNIQSELAASLLADEPNELNISIHMTSVQIINLLAQIGYKAHNIYIFNVQDKNFEDGLIWFGLQKTARDPFHFEKHEEMKATQLLQE